MHASTIVPTVLATLGAFYVGERLSVVFYEIGSAIRHRHARRHPVKSADLP